MNVLITGANGIVGSAIKTHWGETDAYDCTYLDREPHPSDDTVVADVSDIDAIRPAFDGMDAVVHLAVHPLASDEWGEVLETNIVGTYNVVECARRAGVETVVFASSNHVVGMYEVDNRPDIYDGDVDVLLDETTPHRPDSLYGASKGWGEDLLRYYTERQGAPSNSAAIRIASVHPAEYDHPFGPAERGVDEGAFDRDSAEYDRRVARQKAMWQSRRDCAHLFERCLLDDRDGFDVFYGVSDNSGRWHDISHARDRVGYDPQDSADDWTAPPN